MQYQNMMLGETENAKDTITWRFNSHFPDGPGLAAIRMSPFWILFELRMMEVVSGDNWSYKTYKATDIQLITGRMSFLSSKQQRQSTEGSLYCSLHS